MPVKMFTILRFDFLKQLRDGFRPVQLGQLVYYFNIIIIFIISTTYSVHECYQHLGNVNS